MIRLLIADDEKLEREALAELVQRRFERDVRSVYSCFPVALA